MGMFKESECVLKEALEIVMKLYGKDSVEAARVLLRLGVTHCMVSQFPKSRFAILSVILCSSLQ